MPSDYAAQLKALKDEQTRLAHKQAELLDKRRAEVGKLVERIGVLEAEDDLLAGVLLELKQAVDKKDSRLAQWRQTGAAFRKGSRTTTRGHATGDTANAGAALPPRGA